MGVEPAVVNETSKALHASLCQWITPPSAFALEKDLILRWPSWADAEWEGAVGPRLARLQYLVEEGVLCPQVAAKLVLEQPQILSTYSVRIIWECEGLVAVHKPFDMRIDLPRGQEPRWPGERTVADWFSATYPESTVRFCHQLDAGTSGVLLMAATKRAARRGGIAFVKGRARKTYLAIVGMHPPWDGECLLQNRLIDDSGIARRVVREDEQGGETAETIVRVLRRGHLRHGSDGVRIKASLVEARPLTGRQHQIRLQLAHSGYPILGDHTYGSNDTRHYRMFLHATRLELPVPNLGLLVAEASCEFAEDVVET